MTPARWRPDAASPETRVLTVFGVAAGLLGAATWLILDGRLRLAGAAAAAAALVLLAGSVMASDTERPTLVFLDSFMDRSFDGCLLPSIALSVRHGDEAAAAVALATLGAAFIASYVRARGRAVGYPVEQSPLVRLLRYGFICGGLLGRWVLGAMIGALAVVIVSAAAQARLVMTRELQRREPATSS